VSAPPLGLREPRVLGEIRAGLTGTPKRLPFECFYDDLGSALFEAITLLPEYGLTRAGRRLLERHAAEVAELLSTPLDVIELGSGTGRTTRILLEALVRRGPVRYVPVDISTAALEENARELGRLPGLAVEPLAASHLDGLHAGAARRRPAASLLALFLGGNIGNFDRAGAAAFLSGVRQALRPGDALMVAADLEKPEAVLRAAYDDALGVTAAFNLNALARLNRELGADFDLEAFAHRARYDPRERRVEMHLESATAQRVRLAALDLEVDFLRGETIWTESSYRFAPGELAALGERTGFRLAAEWTDGEWPFAQTLLVAR
jgi:dimethylhistidine N-methyltransferase